MNLEKLAKVADSVKETEINGKKIADSARKEALKKKLRDSKIENLRNHKTWRVTDEFVNLRKRVKDELEKTENTEQVIETVMTLLEDQPAEQVIAATLEVIAEAVDLLEAQVDAQVETPAEGDPNEDPNNQE